MRVHDTVLLEKVLVRKGVLPSVICVQENDGELIPGNEVTQLTR